MAIIHLRDAAALLLLVPGATAWSVTNYLFTSTSTWFGKSTASTSTATVTPTGPVTPISSNVSLTTFTSEGIHPVGPGTYIVTVTDLYLSPNASACATGTAFAESCKPPTTSSTGTPTITTRYFAPVVVANPNSCTKTSFSYTSSIRVDPEELPSGIGLQATNSIEATFVTTYVTTLSTDFGGQAVTTSIADVYLRSGAVQGITAIEDNAPILSQCLDPASYVCQTSFNLATGPACVVSTPITYPPTAPSGGAAQVTNVAPTTSKGGVEGIAGLVDQNAVLGVAGLAAAYLL